MSRLTHKVLKSHFSKKTIVFFRKTTLFLCLLLVLVLQSNGLPNQKKTIHTVAIVHPAIDKDNAVECDLIEVVLSDETKLFYLDVDSVNCGEDVCKVVTVRMFWDELGRYVKYELQDGEGLEKKEGAPFTKEDYSKLEWVLNNKNSELEHVFKEELVVSDFVAHGNVDVDAVSGATSTVTPNETVEGAVWTCFTLWHWANGQMVSKIRSITRDKLSDEKLIKDYLGHPEAAYKKFAIQSLELRKSFDSLTVSAIEKQAITSEYSVFKTGLTYVENLKEELYYSSVSRLFKEGDYKKRVACLNSVSETNKGGNTAYYNELSKNIADFSFQEVEMFLTNLKLNNFSSPTLTQNLVALLKADNFLIARRAYWFLSNQEELLTSKQKKRVKKFRKKYKDRL
ncbi:hypothetical protein [Wenyingzhuangia sp. IMCC45574]